MVGVPAASRGGNATGASRAPSRLLSRRLQIVCRPPGAARSRRAASWEAPPRR